jgi:D-alanine-D-alanine ligase-like ATP-grasp enzyme
MEAKGYRFEVRQLGLNHKEFVTLISPKGGRLTLSATNPLYPFATASARLISKNKLMAYDYMRTAHVNVPMTTVVSRANRRQLDTSALFQKGHKYIVKPNSGAGSVGLTLDVDTVDRLSGALDKALQGAAVALVQPQFVGQEVRLTVINGKVCSALLRQKPQVVGDGSSSIGILIGQENAARSMLRNTQVPYPTLDEALVDSSLLTSTTIPVAGEVIELNKSTMIRGGASVFEILPSLHRSYVEAAERAVRDLGNGLVVVDIMVSAPEQPATADNYVFIEMNLCPALVLYYSCRDGRHFDILEDYLGPMLQRVTEAGLLA